MLEKLLQSEAIGSSLVPWQGKSGLFWGAESRQDEEDEKAQKRWLFGCIVWATLGTRMEILGKQSGHRDFETRTVVTIG